ncbi:MAG: 2OG-Fe(II) oxygenase [Acidimicrobiales bacterium]
MTSFSDLQQILGYQGAIPESDDDSLTEVGNEMYRTSFWTPTFCDTVIRAAEAIGAFEQDEDDPVPGHEVSLAVISPALFEHVQNDIGMRIFPRLRTVWPYIDYYGLRDAFVIKYELGGQETLRIHHDVAQVSASLKLNDTYTGGELVFPRQGVSNAEMAVGDLVVWPSLVTHPHECVRLTGGVKYSLTIWFELPQI